MMLQDTMYQNKMYKVSITNTIRRLTILQPMWNLRHFPDSSWYCYPRCTYPPEPQTLLFFNPLYT